LPLTDDHACYLDSLQNRQIMLQDSFNHGNTGFEGYELSKTMILDLSEAF
jgi:hypothetical protein